MVTDPFAEFNAGVQRARADYELAPIRACDAYDECTGMTPDRSVYCRFRRSHMFKIGDGE